jgi:hypothetical protein
MARIGDGLLTHQSVGSLFKRDDDHDSDDDCVVESRSVLALSVVPRTKRGNFAR